MNEYVYHLTGMCGEHWHPNLINLSLAALLAYAAYRAWHKQRA